MMKKKKLKLNRGRLLRSVYFKEGEYERVLKAVAVKNKEFEGFGLVSFNSFARGAIDRAVNQILKEGI